MESKQMFSDAKEGDRVWSITAGWGTVYTPVSYEDVTGIAVKFDNGGTSSYYPNGKLLKEDERPELYWDEIKFEAPEKPKKKVKKEIALLVEVLPKSEPTPWQTQDGCSVKFLMGEKNKYGYQYGAFSKTTVVPAILTFEIEE